MKDSTTSAARGTTIVTPAPAPSRGEPNINKNPSAKGSMSNAGLSHSISGATMAGAAGKRAGRPGAKSR